MTDGPVSTTPDGVRVALHVTPRASRNAVTGIGRDADGNRSLKISVTAPPDGGKANAAVLKLLSKSWKLPKSSLTVLSGAASRRKALAVAGDGPVLAARIRDWMETLPHG